MPAIRVAAVLVGATLIAAVAGCSYTSTYVAPEDGRARVSWVGGEFVPVTPKGESCATAALSAVAVSHSPSRSTSSAKATPQEMMSWPFVVTLLVVASLPVLAMALADSRIESADRAVDAIDLVNATNELARTAESPCARKPSSTTTAPAEARP